VADDEKTRWAIDVMTAWAHQDSDGGDALLSHRIEAYATEPDGAPGLITGLVNLSGLLLMGMEACTGRTTPEILQAIASTLARAEQGSRDR
jgi:hypothetical protein